MARPTHAFSRYTLIGVANTLIHWQLFFILHAAVGLPDGNKFGSGENQ